MQITIHKGKNAGTLDAFVMQVKWLPGMGEKRATALYYGGSATLDVPPEKETITTNRVNTLVVRGVIALDNVAATPVIEAPMETPATPVATPVATPAINPTDIGAVLGAIVLPAVQSQIQSLVDNAINNRVPREIVIKQANKPDVKIDGHVHPMFEKVMRLVKSGVSVMLVGPAGCGKTHLFSQVCKAMDTRGESISLSGGVTEAHLTGRLLPTGPGGRFEYTESPFVKCYREGKPFLLDEMDGGDPNVLLAINQATANGGFHVEARAASGLDTYVERHPDSIIMSTANTYGTGAGALYVGRNQLDAATLDRWYTVQMDYDKAYEEKCAPSQVTHFVWRLRETIAANRWRRVASTRMIQKAGAALGAGLSWTEVKEDLLSAYTAEERSKIAF